MEARLKMVVVAFVIVINGKINFLVDLRQHITGMNSKKEKKKKRNRLVAPRIPRPHFGFFVQFVHHQVYPEYQ